MSVRQFPPEKGGGVGAATQFMESCFWLESGQVPERPQSAWEIQCRGGAGPAPLR